jgi:hypothetical protein
MSLRTVFATLTASLAIHAVVGYTLYLPWSPQYRSPEKPIMISYMRPENTAAAVLPAPKMDSSKKVIEKRIQRIPAKARVSMMLRQAALPAGNMPAAAMTPRNKDQAPSFLPKPKTGAELMADPKKSRMFVSYFGLVKDRIHEVLLEKYDHAGDSPGSVSLSFVLGSDGSLEKIFVNEKESHASAFLKTLAVECLKEAAPFTSFPKDLESRQIAFSLTVYFDET